MKRLTTKEKDLIAEFLSNIGVAWFAAGVITLFVSLEQNLLQNVISLAWGVGFSFSFLSFGMYFARGSK